jgi:tetraacyldisaccharide 4'-kinase
MLPYGNLRESRGNMSRADVILITKSPEDITAMQRRLIVKSVDKAPYQKLYFTSFTYKAPLPLFEIKEKEDIHLDLSENKGYGAVLVTGIANPFTLKEYLEKTSDKIIHLSFPDHYNFKENDITSISKAFEDLRSQRKYVFTTEKDAARLREFTNIAEPFRSAFFYIPIGICFLNNDQNEFNKMIIDYVRNNKRNNRVSEI